MFGKIFGVPPRTTDTAAHAAPVAAGPPEFIPVSKLTPDEQLALEEHGVVECAGGVCYSPWNTSADGELWLRQIASADGEASARLICGA